MFIFGALGRNRTGTPIRARDFKSLVSTYFTTKAYYFTSHKKIDPYYRV